MLELGHRSAFLGGGGGGALLERAGHPGIVNRRGIDIQFVFCSEIKLLSIIFAVLLGQFGLDWTQAGSLESVCVKAQVEATQAALCKTCLVARVIFDPINSDFVGDRVQSCTLASSL
jgi:hypothetical protein